MLHIRLAEATTVVMLSIAAVAFAATPLGSAHFKGSGKLCVNNTPDHRFTNCADRDKFSFHTSSSGRKVLNFAGKVGPLYCGGATYNVTADKMRVRRHGRFHKKFTASDPNHPGGQDSVAIKGRFVRHRVAKVSYKLILLWNGDCGGLVRGKAHAQ
jgi:hypothetical protein